MRTYHFTEVDRCNMCGSGRHRHKILGMRLDRSQGRNPTKLTGIAVGVKRCVECDLIFNDPLPVPDNLAEHYDMPPEDYGQSIPDYDPSYFSHEIDTAKGLLDFKPGMKALDIGAGLGRCMRSLQSAGFDAWGIEPSRPFRDTAIERFGISPERLQLTDLEDAGFPTGTFDFITFGAVLEHLYDPSAAIRKAMEWLQPSGVIQAEVPSSAHLVPRWVNLFFKLRGTNYVTNTSPMHSPFHLYEFGLRSFEAHARREGYQIARHQFSVCEIFHFPRLLHPPLRWWMERRGTGMQLTVYLRKL